MLLQIPLRIQIRGFVGAHTAYFWGGSGSLRLSSDATNADKLNWKPRNDDEQTLMSVALLLSAMMTPATVRKREV